MRAEMFVSLHYELINIACVNWQKYGTFWSVMHWKPGADHPTTAPAAPSGAKHLLKRDDGFKNMWIIQMFSTIWSLNEGIPKACQPAKYCFFPNVISMNNETKYLANSIIPSYSTTGREGDVLCRIATTWMWCCGAGSCASAADSLIPLWVDFVYKNISDWFHFPHGSFENSISWSPTNSTVRLKNSKGQRGCKIVSSIPQDNLWIHLTEIKLKMLKTWYTRRWLRSGGYERYFKKTEFRTGPKKPLHCVSEDIHHGAHTSKAHWKHYLDISMFEISPMTRLLEINKCFTNPQISSIEVHAKVICIFFYHTHRWECRTAELEFPL